MPQPLRQPDLGKRLRELREQAQLSRTDLARAIDVSTGSLARLEAGKDVRVSVYLRVVDYFLARLPEPWMSRERPLLARTPAPGKAPSDEA